MDSLLTAGRTIKVVEELRETVNGLVARETTLIEARDQELDAIRRKYDLLKARDRQQSEEAAGRASAQLQAKRSRLESKYDGRQRWIEESLKRAKAALDHSEEQTLSQQKYENQKDLLLASRKHDADSVALDKTLKSFTNELDVELERFEVIKERVWRIGRVYSPLRKSFEREPEDSSGHEVYADEYQGLEELRAELQRIEKGLGGSLRTSVVRFFSAVPFWMILLLISVSVGLGYAFPQIGDLLGINPGQILQGGLIASVAVSVAYGAGFLLAKRPVQQLIGHIWRVHGLSAQCRDAARRSRERAIVVVQDALQEVEGRLESAWQSVRRQSAQTLRAGMEKLDKQSLRLLEKNKSMRQLALASVSESEGGALGVGAEERVGGTKIAAEQAALEAEVVKRFADEMDTLVGEWNERVPKRVDELERSGGAGAIESCWGSDTSALQHWQAPREGNPAGQFASLSLNCGRIVEALPVDPRMDWDAAGTLLVPLAVKMPLGESVLFESDGTSPQEVVNAMNEIVLRLLMSSPVGRLRFTLIDPVGLGQNFAGLMHLADYDDQIVNRRIWTQSAQVDQCLKDLTEHMEKVTQMYLRNEYDSLAEYNRVAGNVAEKFHLLVVSDFPVGFSESALRRLQSIAVSGPRCGVFLILHRDRRQPLLDDSVLDDLRKHCVWLESHGSDYRLGAFRWRGAALNWNESPDSQSVIDLIHRIGQASVDSNRVEVPFSHVVPPEETRWSLETGEVIKVPIGRTGASKLQYLTLGKGTQQHALIAGKTGSGKSTLFHVIITNLALWCRPDQVEFYLVDFKKGVEFKCYATHRLPHAKVVAIESDREFGLSVLERVDQELRRRGDLFRDQGVQDLASYRKAAPGEMLPRTLVLIDEFQEYFVEDDRVAQNAAVLLDRIVRQGRAFGIHVILGSQTLGGAYTLARTTFAQMVVRVALQCDEADSYLIMDENNSAPRLLSRPGEGIYNDSSGATEGNSPFQAVWLSDEERDGYLQEIRRLAEERVGLDRVPVVFEGNAPAKIEDNQELRQLLENGADTISQTVRAWLGAPNSIKGPTNAAFDLQSGSNLLVLGQNEEMAFSLVLCGLVSLAAHYPAEGAEFVIVDAIAEHSPQRELLDRVLSFMPHRVRTLKDESLETVMSDLSALLETRVTNNDPAGAVFVVVLGIQSFKKLRPEDEFSFSASDESMGPKPGDVFDRIIREGPAVGMRALVTVDSYNSSQRYLSRKALSEFEMRVLFQMSANDSAALIDSTKASQLGLHRALFYNERKGHLETFRPYALPGNAWLTEVEALLGGERREVESTPS